MTRIYSKHDKFFRSSMSDRRYAKEFFEQHLPARILEQVALDSLVLQSGSFVDKALRAAMSDILYAVRFKGRPGYLYTLVEHQSEPDALMPFRLWVYMIRIMEQHIKQTQEDTLPIIYPLVFYNGQKRYHYSTDLFDLFGEGKDLAKDILYRPFQLVDVQRLPDEALRQRLHAGLMQFVMKHIYARDMLPHLQRVIGDLQLLVKEGEEDFVETALVYVITSGEIKDRGALLETVRTGLSEEWEEKVMTLAEQWRAEGRMEGETSGVIKGQAEAKRAVAFRLLKAGVDVVTIASATGLSRMEIEEFQQETVH